MFGHGAEIETVLALVYDGDKLPPGATLDGPAVIEEITTSIVIEPGWAATLDASGVYVLEDKVAGRWPQAPSSVSRTQSQPESAAPSRTRRQLMMQFAKVARATVGTLSLAISMGAMAKDWWPFNVVEVNGDKIATSLRPTTRPPRNGTRCVLVPYMKDSFWVATAYGDRGGPPPGRQGVPVPGRRPREPAQADRPVR